MVMRSLGVKVPFRPNTETGTMAGAAKREPSTVALRPRNWRRVTVGLMLLCLQDRSHFVAMSRFIEPLASEVRIRLGAPASLPAWTRGQLAGKDAGAPRAERLRPQIASPVPRAPTHKNKNQISR